MILDASVIALLAVAATLGALAGLLRPLFLALGSLLGWLAARQFSAPVGRTLARWMPESAARPVAAALLFAAVATVVILVGSVLRRGRGGGARPTDRAAGALLGGTAAAALAWIALAVADAAAPVLGRPAQLQLARSDLAALVRENDVLGAWRRPAEDMLRRLLAAASDPGKAAGLSLDPDVRSLLADPRLQGLVDEARGGARGEPARSPDALRLLSDPEFRTRLEAAQRRLDAPVR